MERPLFLKPLSIQDENSVIHRKKVGADGISKTSGPLAKKSGVVRESRKALNDITNKSSIRPETTSKSKKSGKKQSKVVENGYSNQQVLECEALSKKKISVHEKLNIAEEGFLHDHSKCIDAQKAAAASQLNFWDTVLPGHDSTDLIMERPKGDPDNCYPKLEELSMLEFSDWFKPHWKSPPPSPLHQDSPSAWEFEAVELLLKEDDYHVGRDVSL
ncbi:protein PATRONUS 2-like [Salvia miltiorrhiza]|uniref:protein PATRONUS 2-like n=1 Tax=Salvia miltiorrhiza TaxID=226208 RepID=UPI0025AC157B|nr:protein PATRONUS 2-like [Salvia miltiorrhiza]XP_057790247.1 protein PATRONUS 2-like [Salvia miltiorrhiza]